MPAAGRRGEGGRRSFAPILLLATAIGVLIVVALAIAGARNGEGGSAEAAGDATLPASLSATPGTPEGTAESGIRRIVTGGGPVATESVPRPADGRSSIPVSVAIPALGVEAAIEPVGATPDGIRVPPVYLAGWHRGGPRPGEPGRAILLGHLDSVDGPAAFTPLPGARPGLDIAVTDRAGAVHRFRVLRTLEVSKSDFPTEEVYGTSRRPGLVLITCGGEFVPDQGYENNFIVFARELRNA